MRVIVVGLGVQGYKRIKAAGKDFVASVDPINPEADYKDLADVPLADYDAALVCTPDEPKQEILTYLLENSRHVLVEKPLFAKNNSELEKLAELSENKGVTCYTAYNHRFEPHFIRMRELVRSGRLGQPYFLNMFYGNGTARLVRDSAWRDQGAGVLPDLGSHFLDTILFWFGKPENPFEVVSRHAFENRAFDQFCFASEGPPYMRMEMTLLSWRNHFYADLHCEKGSAHISSLCKWGPSTFIVRTRKLPSGRPDEEQKVLVQPDPTWDMEYQYFRELCKEGSHNIENDIYINTVLAGLAGKSVHQAAG
ncbi:MAG: Gfo/Idh/MocA family oxidoreductase [Desulfarculaceae bacterium]|nr:Gfo/Idh/MocA family oxidoreductase [Desulfarculaceae bacterium]MCF8072944.1 Gfo/Idh/MocA family oxidoreductase [Desulfarculaceae bacterium]MCF8101112.1 Gfo/Idh/MocA family oxidoreductase [Desulfarculaceae bacterium]MCF8115501.1 Gfo/Idh/MocA family oxidoreductase [Desulfarculaceae bacterium]